MKIPPAAKVGLLVIVSIAILITSLMWLKGRSFSTGKHFQAKFHDIDGMRPGSMVQLMGLRIGQVEKISPVVNDDESYVNVDFIITKENVSIPQGSTISVQQSGIIGEKFIEITPPLLLSIDIPVDDNSFQVPPYTPIKLHYKDKLHNIGEVRSSKVITKLIERYLTTNSGFKVLKNVKQFYKINYVITRPGLEIEDFFTFNLSDDNKSIIITPPNGYIVNLPPENQVFISVDPLRIKCFMEQQVKSAKALEITNNKINALLAPEQIQDLKDTLKNTKILTGRSIDVIDEVNKMLTGSKDDLQRLVDSSTNLSENMIVISKNINSIIGDPQLRSDILETVSSVKSSTKELSGIISDPNIKETIAATKETSKNFQELISYIKDVTTSNDLKNKLNSTITNMNTSLESLTVLLNKFEKITNSEEDNIKKIFEETADTSENIKKFSKKLNKRFLLFRLMF